VGSIPLNLQAKLERDEDLGIVIHMIRTRYAKAFNCVWMERDWKSASNKTMWHKVNGFFT